MVRLKPDEPPEAAAHLLTLLRTHSFDSPRGRPGFAFSHGCFNLHFFFSFFVTSQKFQVAQKWLRGTQTFQGQRDCNGGDRDLLVCHKSRLPLLGIKQQFCLVAPIQLKQRCKKWKILAEYSTWNLSYTTDWAYFRVQQWTGGEVVEWLVLLPSFVCFPAKNVREPLLSVGFLWVLYFLPQFKCFASKVNWEMNPVHWWRKLGTGNWDDKPT